MKCSFRYAICSRNWMSDNYDDHGNGRHEHATFARALTDIGNMYWEVFNETVCR